MSYSDFLMSWDFLHICHISQNSLDFDMSEKERVRDLNHVQLIIYSFGLTNISQGITMEMRHIQWKMGGWLEDAKFELENVIS